MWAHAWRTIVVVLPVLVASAVAALSGAAGQPLSWLVVPVGLGLGAAGLAWLAWWRRPGRRAGTTLLAAAAVAWGLTVSAWSPPGTGVLAAALDELEVPEGARLVEQSSGGNVLCFDVCTTVRRRYVVPDAAPGELASRMRQALRDAGHTLDEPVDARSFTTTLDGELHLSGRADPRPEGRGAVLQLRAVASG